MTARQMLVLVAILLVLASWVVAVPYLLGLAVIVVALAHLV